MLGPLVLRPIIQEKFKHKYPILTRMVEEDLDAVKKLHDHQMTLIQTTGPQLNKNMPKVAGMLKWSQELRERVHLSIDKFKALNHGYVTYDGAIN